MPGMTIRESFETRSEVERELNHTCDDSGQYAQKNLNISQTSVCVGQQGVEGRRIPF